ncbi:unnamed protein product [Rodentolepis nana]|nr:unnamed protein product [Rodentolepis nana]
MTVEVLGKLRWLETEDIYVTIKARPGVGAVFSGNNKGGVWIYDVFRYVSNGGPHPKFDIPPIKVRL